MFRILHLRFSTARSFVARLITLSVFLVSASFAFGATTNYVTTNGTGNGTTWALATSLTNALASANSNDQIWVAEGTYVPGTNRTDTFQLKNGVDLYGGFTNGMATMGERDWNANVTILSGDINTPGTKADNSYHVVTGTNNTTIDGFTITAGNADGSESNQNDRGGGMYNTNSSPGVQNCTFSGNSAIWLGGGMYNQSYPQSSSPTVQNCTFSGNSALAGGGGMFNDNSSPTVQNCTFSGNSSAYEGGGMYNGYSSPTVQNCTFSGNSAGEKGGGMCNYASSPTIQNCTFSGNWNSASNWAWGGGMYNYSSSPTIQNCTFSGNSANDYGGGMFNDNSSSPTIQNCTFSGNSADVGGGGMANWTSSSPTMTNCILWGNSASSGDEIYNADSSTPTVSFCDIDGGWNGPGVTNASGCTNVNGGGNINSAPLFVGGTNGLWTQDATYNSTNVQSTLTDTNASWILGEMAGKFVNPYTNQVLQYLVVTNDSDALTVWGDVTGIASNGFAYQIYDYHLESVGGHWETGLSAHGAEGRIAISRGIHFRLSIPSPMPSRSRYLQDASAGIT